MDDGSYANLIGLTLASSKRLKGDELLRNGPCSLCENLLLLPFSSVRAVD